MRILYVEDNPSDAELTRRELRRLAPQYQLDVADTLAGARQALTVQPLPYAAVLLDLRLPDGDGLSLLNFIRTSELPVVVIILTGGGDEDTAVSALKAGADDYLIKQVEYFSTLVDTLESALVRSVAGRRVRDRRLRVLYAERHSQDVDLTRRHLARHASFIQLEVLANGDDLLEALKDEVSATHYDVLLLDYRLGPMNGMELIKRISRHGHPMLPVVLVTGQGNEEIALQALKLGASDYVVKNPGYLYRLPSVLENAFHMAELHREQAALQESERRFRLVAEKAQDVIFIYRVHEHRFLYISPALFDLTGYTPEEVYARPDLWQKFTHPADTDGPIEKILQDGAPLVDEKIVRWLHRVGRVIWIEQRFSYLRSPEGDVVEIQGIARDVTARIENQSQHEYRAVENEASSRRMYAACEKTLEAIAAGLELRDRDSRGYSQRVARLAVRTAVALGITGEALDHIHRGALLHDIGKLGIPDSILLKPGPLTDAEWTVMRMHPVYSYQLLYPVEYLRPAIDIPYCHRERWDGSGYPHGLKGEDIPIAARIFAVVDVWVALNTDRPYRPAWDRSQVARFLREQAGGKFDPRVVAVFLEKVALEE